MGSVVYDQIGSQVPVYDRPRDAKVLGVSCEMRDAGQTLGVPSSHICVPTFDVDVKVLRGIVLAITSLPNSRDAIVVERGDQVGMMTFESETHD